MTLLSIQSCRLQPFEVFPLPQILRCINSLQLLSPTAISSPLPVICHLNYGHHLPGWASPWHPSQRSLAPRPRSPESPLCSQLSNTEPKHQESVFSQEQRPMLSHRRIVNFYLGARAGFSAYTSVTFPGGPAGYFLQRSRIMNYLHKGLRPWAMPGSEESPSGRATPPCAH